MRTLKITKSFTNREDNTLNIYLNDIAQYPLLDTDEEVELARRARSGDPFARERLVNCNLRFVVSVAKQYQGLGIPLMDLIGEGNFGLMKAVDRYDETRGFKFISYAVNWIRQALLNAISSQARMVRLPVNKVAEIQKLKKTTSTLEQQLGRIPSIEELAEQTGIPESRISELWWFDSRSLSLDAPVSAESDTCWESLISASDYVRTDDKLLRESFANDLNTILDKLPEKESQVLRLRYGFGTTHEHTMEEIGDSLKVSRERVRQIYETAMRHLRKSGDLVFLQQYLAA